MAYPAVRMDQIQVARHLGISRASVSRYEISGLRKIREALLRDPLVGGLLDEMGIAEGGDE